MAKKSNPRQVRHIAPAPAPTDPKPVAKRPIEQRPAAPIHTSVPKKKSWFTPKRIIWSCIGLLLLIGIAIGVKFIIDISNPQSLFQQPPVTTPTPVPTPDSVQDGADVQPTPVPTPSVEERLLSTADLEFMKNRVNILLLGIDESTERESWGSFRTDTMILLTINFDTNDVDMISIPRDSCVKICNGDQHIIKADENGNAILAKVNSAFPSGGGAQKSGYQYAMGTVSRLLGGIPIHYYVGFNMNVVKEVVNAMGGVDYDVDIEVTMNGRKLHPGFQHLDGQAVLDYCRQRKGSSDVARVQRQQNMILSIVKQLKSTGQIGNIPSIYRAVEKNIQTNLSFTQISSLALMALNLDMEQIEKHLVPGEFIDMNQRSYWAVHTAKLKSIVSDVFGIDMRQDMDIDASTLKESIRLSMELIQAELNRAQIACQRAEALLSEHRENIAGSTAEEIEALVKQLEDAQADLDKASLDTYTPQLEQLCASLEEKLLLNPFTPVTPVTPDPFDPFAEPTPAPDNSVFDGFAAFPG